jgi:lysophospholipid acyltransferase
LARLCGCACIGLRQLLRPLFLLADGKTATSAKWLYDVVGWVVTMATLNYICASFVLLSWGTSIALYQSLFFCIHVAAAALLVLFSLVPAKKTGPRPAKPAKTE